MEPEGSKIDWPRAVVVVAAVFAVVLWGGWLLSTARTGFTEDADIPIAFEYAMFHGGASMIRDGSGAEVYDLDLYREVMSEVVDEDRSDEVDAYLLAPFFAAALTPLTYLPYRTAWLIWTMLGVAALYAGFVLLRARPLPALTVSLAFAPVFWTLRTGQASWLAYLLMAGSYRALDQGSPVVAGFIAGGLVYKPQMALGLGVWWLIDRRYWKTLASMALSGLVLVAVSWVIAPGWLLPYLDVLRSATGWFSNPGFLTNAYSPARVGTALLPAVSGASSVFLLIAWGVGIWAFVVFKRRHEDEWKLLFAAAVVLGVWMTPHLLVYDWTVLLVPATILWVERPDLRRTWIVLGAVLALGAAVSGILTEAMFDVWGRALQPAPIVLAVVAVLAARVLDREAEPAVR